MRSFSVRTVLLLLGVCCGAGVVFAAAPLKDLSLPWPQNLQDYRKIRILVSKNKAAVQVSCKDSYEVWDDRGRLVFKGADLPGATVKPAASGLQWWKQSVETRFFLLRTQGAGIRVGQVGVFRDTVFVYKNSAGKLDIINELKIDDYLKGVVPFEGNPKWSMESLKAQAIVSRTFALTRMMERHGQEYDVMSGVFSQVYAGKKIEDERTNEAVEVTRGQVLTYNKKLFPAYFHSTCGGATTAADLVWPVKPHPALRGVECRFCQKAPHYKWESKVQPSEIKAKLAQHG
ncbi:MAG: SpoIID/LytB domain-containing protein, partial [Candidatus Omnitrophica bacterium]|nr:SpoIID/LytB domain-containing protein [Candidatus Omnitrophota bacterium]